MSFLSIKSLLLSVLLFLTLTFADYVPDYDNRCWACLINVENVN